ncbi:hypothetical protein JVT61DRAFT_12827 [Boletus reticuloceps]|uniref:Uncharacterized protein n=1 Tax=Boletus reticuloceps TaxID=495285 RepID=A0A8I2YXY7_9AGAM|nr:hypothetical protein JVT61DRAFT_12827 [Boletus reticuloceps]
MSPVKPAAFSRLQLAAALLEYDNDSDNPDAPCRSAHESAIFAHLRRHVPLNKSRRSTDYLGVQVPSEVGSDPPNRRSRSIDTLRNPFGDADEEDESADEGGVEVDLTSWGLDAFMDKNKTKGKGRGKAKSEILPNPHVDGPVRTAHSVAGDTPHSRMIRSMSVGNLDGFGAGGAFLDTDNSFARVRSSTDLDQFQSLQPPLQRRRASAHVLIETLPVQPPLHSVPFPSVSVSGRSSPGPEEILRPGFRSSRLDLQTAHARTQSNTSLGSKALLNDASNDENANPFVVQPPSPDRASRFDPKANRGRTMSNGSMGTMASKNILADDNVFSVRPPSPSRSSRFDPKTHGRTSSVNSMGTRMLLENDVDTESRRDRPLSTLELLRPKILVMPSPLQSTVPAQPPQSATRPHSGFQVSTDDPLPPAARSSRLSVPVASNSFTPNPRASLSLSQLAFRNTLVVGGQRDIAYSDIDRHFPRALKDGEQAHFEMEEEESPVPSSVPLPPVPLPTELENKRPAGKLYGRSLIDNLEHRKLEMKQKARTFQGDNRPSMMIRGQIRRSSTLIDPDLLGPSSNPQNADNRASAFTRRSSAARLLDSNGEKPPIIGASSSSGDLPQSRSVFGVDTLWDQGTGRRQRKKKGKSKLQETESTPPQTYARLQDVSESRVSSEPPMLPAVQKPVLRRAPVADDDVPSESENDEDDEDDVPLGQALGRITDKAADNWVAESSDEDEGPRRTTGHGPRDVAEPPLNRGEDEDSEEDLPLTAAAERIAKRATQLPPLKLVDDDEDKPLAAVLSESKMSFGQSKLSLPNLSFDHLSGGRPLTNDDDDDEQPLGLRASRLPAMVSHASLPLMGGPGVDEDDEKPLAFHPEQQRRAQYQMLAQLQQQQQQQQQQQMMMQAQMHNNFYFGPPAMMGTGFFGMGVPPLMGIPMPPSPPPAHDATKYGRVDRWRHDVAVEGEP